MRYNVTFNQQELMAYNERHPEKKIDFKDAIILQQLWHLSTWGEVEKVDLADGQYFWVAYGKLNAELPSLGFKNNDTLGKRIKARLLNFGLLKRHVCWKDNSKTFWKFTEVGLRIAEPGKDPSRSNDGTRGGRMATREGVASSNERGSHGDANNYNTNDSFTKDERDALSHFSFIKEVLKEDYTNWKTEYERKIFNHKEFIAGFNNTMQTESFPKSNKLIFRLNNFARHWVKNQTEDERPAPVRKIWNGKSNPHSSTG